MKPGICGFSNLLNAKMASPHGEAIFIVVCLEKV